MTIRSSIFTRVRIAASGLARQPRDDGSFGAARECLEQAFHDAGIRQVREAGNAPAQLTRSLRTPQQQFTDDAGFLRREPEAAELGIAENLLILGHAAAEA